MKDFLDYSYFTSSKCRGMQHSECEAIWEGLNIRVFCECSCHKERALANVGHRSN